jgi:acyl-CoA reductase-like NAD-dependent aldehyde dehydrogenase
MAEIIVARNPSTGEALDELPVTPVAEVHAAIERARAVAGEWRGRGVEERIDLFGNLARVMRARADEIIDLVRTESGKILSDAEYELYDILDGIEHYSRQLRLITAQYREIPRSYFPSGTRYNTAAELRLEPHGVVAAIMPWNFPFWIPMTNLVPALLAGNTVVFKPSEYTPLTGQKIVELFEAAGFPDDVLQLVQGADEVGRALVSGDTDMVMFTGGLAAAQHITRNAGLKPVSIESGGNTGSLVCADADLEIAVAGTLWGGLYHAGQSCSSHKRVYVHQHLAEPFIERVLEKVQRLRPLEHYGPYIRREAMDAVHARVEDAIGRGAELLAGGAPLRDLPEAYRNGYWYAPTVMTYTDDTLPVVCEEVFGNILTIRVVESEEEGIARINDTNYGLTAIAWTMDLERGQQLADRLDAGMVFVNDAELVLVAGEYWGGWKESGIGGMGSKLEKCLKQKLVVTHTGASARNYWF